MEEGAVHEPEPIAHLGLREDVMFFGERVAAHYDDRSGPPARETVDFLAELAGDGAALEFAIGTGRVAVPLAQRGVKGARVDNPGAMLRRPREKTHEIQVGERDITAKPGGGGVAPVVLLF